jgi:hypothetical protein
MRSFESTPDSTTSSESSRSPGEMDMHQRRRMMEPWAPMIPEKREKCRQSMRGRCGPFAAPISEMMA